MQFSTNLAVLSEKWRKNTPCTGAPCDFRFCTLPTILGPPWPPPFCVQMLLGLVFGCSFRQIRAGKEKKMVENLELLLPFATEFWFSETLHSLPGTRFSTQTRTGIKLIPESEFLPFLVLALSLLCVFPAPEKQIGCKSPCSLIYEPSQWSQTSRSDGIPPDSTSLWIQQSSCHVLLSTPHFTASVFGAFVLKF